MGILWVRVWFQQVLLTETQVAAIIIAMIELPSDTLMIH